MELKGLRSAGHRSPLMDGNRLPYSRYHWKAPLKA